jgi:hypothetical protein
MVPEDSNDGTTEFNRVCNAISSVTVDAEKVF